MYEVAIFFAGPQYAWGGEPSENERIGTLHARWLWLARLRAQAVYPLLNAGRCCILITRNGQFVERWLEPAPVVVPANKLDHGLPR